MIAITPKNSLKTRISIAVLIIFLLGMCLLSVYATQLLKGDMERLLGEQQFSTVSYIAAEINSQFEERFKALAQVTEHLKKNSKFMRSRELLQEDMEQRFILHRLFNEGDMVIDTDGLAIAATPVAKGRLGTQHIDQKYIAQALQGQAGIGAPIIDPITQSPVFGMAAPIYNRKNQVVGAVAGLTELALSSFLDRVTEYSYGATGKFTLIDIKTQTVVSATGKNRILEKMSLDDMLSNPEEVKASQEILPYDDGYMIYTDASGTEMLASKKSIPLADWYIVAELPTADAFAPIIRAQKRMLAIAVLLSLLVGVAIWRVLKHQLSPIVKTVDALAAMSRGNAPMQPLLIERADEIGSLIASFNRLLSALQLRESHQRALLDNFPFMVWLKDKEGCFLSANQHYANVFGVASPLFFLGKSNFDLFSREEAVSFQIEDQAIMDSKKPQTAEVHLWTKTEDLYFETYKSPIVVDGNVLGIVGFSRDITERKKAEQQIHMLAFFDQLTGLPNRTLLVDRIKQCMAVNARSGNFSALILINLDKFKTLNDTLGHESGDQLLKQVAERLSTYVRAEDTLARIEGDEFVVVLSHLNGVESIAAAQAKNIAEKIIRTLNEPYDLDSVAYYSSLSIGVNVFNCPSVSVDGLLKQVAIAMSRAKKSGGNTLHFFDPGMEIMLMRRATLENELRQAIKGRHLILHYQAQIAEDKLVGAEALVRWQHPLQGVISPGEFIPMAEESKLIIPLGEWVLETACAQLAIWASDPKKCGLSISVNVSAHQFSQENYVDQVLTILARSSANPQRLKLELTESMLVNDPDEVIKKMLLLKEKGVRFSLDDFGTGYSSLQYLKRLPLDQLKIDQSFTKGILLDSNDTSIVKTIISLAKNLGLDVIAEGVETEEQRRYLSEAGCFAYQGYFFSRPLSGEDFERFSSDFFTQAENKILQK